MAMIFSNLGPAQDPVWRDGRVGSDCSYGDLAAVSRTCRTFQEPGLDALWARVSLGNVFCCLPRGDLWEVEVVRSFGSWTDDSDDDKAEHEVSRRMRLLRPVVAKDWERPQMYARRVKHLSCNGPLFFDFEFSKFLQRIMPTLPQDFFPNLLSLLWCFVQCDIAYIPRLLSPTTKEITLVHRRTIRSRRYLLFYRYVLT
ncbi:hypothetical protein FB451DRAFT_736162 [Mycena latifolia]|nr:hypothetical protein FB451DRAFT_736162 [Mycena latifolia]